MECIAHYLMKRNYTPVVCCTIVVHCTPPFLECIITQDIHRSSPSYDDIIDSFLAGITFIDNLDEVKGQCDKFLSALSNVGGPVAFAVNMLRREWDQVMHKD